MVTSARSSQIQQQTADRMAVFSLIPIIVFIIVSLSIVSPSQAADQLELAYSFVDEIPSGSLIASVRNDSGLLRKYSADVASRLKFAFLTHNEQRAYFSLDERSGVLETSRFLDRDAVCPGAARCVLRLSIAVQPAAFYHEIRVHVVLTDANDNPPRFPTDQVTESLAESAQPGSFIQLPPASDLDSPPYGVQRYALVSDGDTFALQVT